MTCTLKHGSRIPRISPKRRALRFRKKPTITIPESLEEQLTQKDTLTLDPETFDPSVTNPDEHPEDTISNVDSNNHESAIPPPNSPRKSKYNLRANPPANWKKDYAYYNPMNIDPIAQN